MTNEQLALLLDPERKRPGWWVKQQKRVYTGPDWHASDDDCFRDWRPVLLAAGCWIAHYSDESCRVYFMCQPVIDSETYRAATLAAIEELHTTKPELLREAIARVEGGANG